MSVYLFNTSRSVLTTKEYLDFKSYMSHDDPKSEFKFLEQNLIIGHKVFQVYLFSYSISMYIGVPT